MIEEDRHGTSEFLKPSKSQRKREMHGFVQLIHRLLELPDTQLASLGLSGAAIKAIGTIRPIRASAARQRQIKYAAKLMQLEDVAIAELVLADQQELRDRVNAQFQSLERWRDRLIAEGDDALSDLLLEFPALDRQQLRQLVRAAQRERDQDRSPVSARKLFKILRTQLPTD